MLRIEKSIGIQAPIEYVFRALTDPARGPEWNPNILDVKHVSDTTIGRGTTWQQTMVMMGRPVELQCEIVQYDPPERGLLQISGGQEASVLTKCERQGDATKVTQVLEFTPPGGKLGMLAGRAFLPRLEHEIWQGMQRQQDILERESAGNYGSRPS